MPSYKIRNGTFVLCTPEEAAERERRKAALAETARAQTAEKKVRSVPDGVAFAKFMWMHANTLHNTTSAAKSLFHGLLFESFRNHGNSFVLPTKQLAGTQGLSRANCYRALQQLEQRGLITVTRRPPKPPLIKLLSQP